MFSYFFIKKVCQNSIWSCIFFGFKCCYICNRWIFCSIWFICNQNFNWILSKIWLHICHISIRNHWFYFNICRCLVSLIKISSKPFQKLCKTVQFLTKFFLILYIFCVGFSPALWFAFLWSYFWNICFKLSDSLMMVDP